MNDFAIHEAELTGALTDLLMGVVIVPLLIILCIRNTPQNRTKFWSVMFFSTLCGSCFLGYLAHNVYTEGMPNFIIWSILLPLMYETFAAFFLFALALITNGAKPTPLYVILAEAYVACAFVFSLFVSPPYNGTHIKILVISGGILALTGFAAILVDSFKKGRIGERIIVASLVFLLPAAYLQFKRTAFVRFIWCFNYNGLAHILIMLGIIAVFVGTMFSLKKRNVR